MGIEIIIISMKKRNKSFKLDLERFEWLFKINIYIFPFLISLTYFFLSLETYTYTGFVRKFFLIDSRIFMFFAVMSTIFLLISWRIVRISKEIKFLVNLVFNLNLLVFPVIFVFSLIIHVTESVNYSNYVFSHVHLHPYNFSLILLLNVFIVVMFLSKTYLFNKLSLYNLGIKSKLKQISLTNRVYWFFWGVIVAYCLIGVIITPSNFIKGLIFLLVFFLISVYKFVLSKDGKVLKPNFSLLVLNKLIMFVSAGIYICFLLLELFNYTNYVLSSFGIFFSPFLYLFLFCVVFTFLSDFKIKSFSGNQNSRYALVIMSILLINLYILTGNFIGSIAKEIDLIIENAGEDYDVKMAARITDFYWFAKFVKENTPEDAVIYLPDQMAPWQRGGNPFYMRYFLYPRKLVAGYYSLSDYNGPRITYYVVSFGDSKRYSEKLRKQWPQFSINARKIIFEDGEVLYNKEYNPDNPIFQNQWAIVEI